MVAIDRLPRLQPRLSTRLYLLSLYAALGLAACGGHGDKPEDVVPSNVFPAPAAVSGPDSFLLWVNRLVTPAPRTAAIDSAEYALAYYTAIDPMNARDTLDKWKTANGFGASGGITAAAVFGDFRDLGYGRRMSGRCDADAAVPTRCSKTGRIAFVVENYLVNPGAEGYGAAINLDAAVVVDRQWIVSINAIEFSPGPGGSARYAKFYSFDPKTGQRVLTQDLDGRGKKALPGACISCHGGRADALTTTGLMPRLQGSEAAQRGDVRGRLHPFEVNALSFSNAAGARQPEQQAALKTLNRMVLCTFPNPNPASTLADDQCRDTAQSGEWQGGAEMLIKAAYAPAMSAAAYQTPPVPADWQGTAGTVVKDDLYRQVVEPACLVCHRLLGNSLQSDLDFASFTKFKSYNERTRHHVFERGNMPLSRVLYQRFWASDAATPTLPQRLADYLKADQNLTVPFDASGRPQQPGAPVAIIGPDRRMAGGTAALSAANSLFADSYRWTLVSGPDGALPATGATLTGAATATATFASAAAGKRYVVQLVASRSGVDSAPARVTLFVTGTAATSIRLADARAAVAGCLGSGCHSSIPNPPPVPAPVPARLAFDGSDDELFGILRSRLNFDELAVSRLLSKPAGEHHGGGSLPQPGFDATLPVGDVNRQQRDVLIDWALSGAQR